MAESVDALVSNTSGATHPGSIPGLGTKKILVEHIYGGFSFIKTSNLVTFGRGNPKGDHFFVYFNKVDTTLYIALTRQQGLIFRTA